MSHGGIVVDLTSKAAIATAVALGTMPLLARVASALADDLDGRRRPTAALGLEAEAAPR